MRRPEVLDALRAEGLTVVEVNGWQTRGGTTFAPFGSLEHGTAGAPTGCAPSLGAIVSGGNSTTPPPLSHTLQSRCQDAAGLDVVYLAACGRANHAGVGSWGAANGNEDLWGNEVEHVNTTAEPLPDGRVETSVRIHTAFAKVSGFPAGMVAQHWEYADPDGRKSDLLRGVLDPAVLRYRVALRLAGITLQEDDPMPLIPNDVAKLANGRWPRLDVVDKTATSCTVLVSPGIALLPGLDQLPAPTFRYGPKRGDDGTLFVSGLTSPARGVEQTPNGRVVLVCLDGSTFDITA